MEGGLVAVDPAELGGEQIVELGRATVLGGPKLALELGEPGLELRLEPLGFQPQASDAVIDRSSRKPLTRTGDSESQMR